MKRVRLQPVAEADIAAAAFWYESEQPGLGIRFILELDAALERASENPLSYECVVGSARRVLARRFPYAVYFTFAHDVVTVVAVLHQHRDRAGVESRLDR